VASSSWLAAPPTNMEHQSSPTEKKVQQPCLPPEKRERKYMDIALKGNGATLKKGNHGANSANSSCMEYIKRSYESFCRKL